MSLSKMDQVFPPICDLKSDAELVKSIANCLRSEYGMSSSAIKRIARDSKASPRAVRNWYEAKNLISVRHLLLLARKSNGIRQLIIILSAADGIGSKLAPYLEIETGRIMRKITLPVVQDAPIQATISGTIKFEHTEWSTRQEWFLRELRGNIKTDAKDIISRWNVSLRTARRDIQKLLAQGLIDRSGSKKSGRYVLVNTEDQSFKTLIPIVET